MIRAHFLIAAVVSIHLCVPGVVARAQVLAGARVDVPVKVTLEPPLSQVIESSSPGVHDAEGAWSAHGGWGIKYRIERDAVRTSIQGTTIRVSVDLRYRLEIARQVPRPWPFRGSIWATLGSCGHVESMRRVTVDFESTLRLGPDWNVQSSSRVLGTQHHDRCRITIADISITSLLDGKLQRKLHAMAGKLDQHIQRRLALRSRAESLWKRITMPLHIGEVWLTLNLERVSITPPRLTETSVSTDLRIRMRPVFFIGSSPRQANTKLPRLGQHQAGGAPGFQGDVSIVLPFETVKAWLSKGIEINEQDPLLVSKSTITVNAGRVRLVARLMDPELSVAIEVEPRLEPAAGTLSFGNVAVRVDDFDSPLRDLFEEQMREDIQSFSYSLEKHKQALLDKTWYLGEGAQRLAISVATLDFRDLQVTPEAIILVTSATGGIDVAPVVPEMSSAPPER
jgi:hypothetical protein